MAAFSTQPARSTYAGLFLATLSLLQLELFLTRIFSVTMVSFFLGPYYERENRKDIAAAVYEEALKQETDPSERRDLEEKIKTLRAPTGK